MFAILFAVWMLFIVLVIQLMEVMCCLVSYTFLFVRSKSWDVKCQIWISSKTAATEGKTQPEVTFFFMYVLLVTHRSEPYLYILWMVLLQRKLWILRDSLHCNQKHRRKFQYRSKKLHFICGWLQTQLHSL